MVLAAAASACVAAPMAVGQVTALSTPAFISAAASTDEFERQAGRLADRQAASPRVRSFGRMMVRDHTNTTMALKQAIRRAGLPQPPAPTLTSDQQSNMAALRGLQGPAFDQTYMQQQEQAHEEALGVMRAYAHGGDNRVLRAAAASTVPIVQRHLTMANQITRGPGPR
jgi:putative membrane protein